MALATVSARIDADDKRIFDSFCSSVGLTSSAALNIFVKKVIREHRIPFEIECDPFYSESNMRFLRDGVEALNSGKGVEHEIIEVTE